MTTFGASFLQFPNSPDLNPDHCYPYLMEYAPLIITYLANEQRLAAIFEKTVAGLVEPTRQAIEATGNALSVKSGAIIKNALLPIVGKLNSGFYALVNKVQCGVQPVLCSTVAKFSEIIPIKKWRISVDKT